MTNKYKSPCADCGKEVPAKMGTLSKEGKRWAVRCQSCESTSRGIAWFDRFDMAVEDRMAEQCGLSREQSGW